MLLIHNATPCCNASPGIKHSSWTNDDVLEKSCRMCGRKYTVTFEESFPFKGATEHRLVRWEAHDDGRDDELDWDAIRDRSVDIEEGEGWDSLATMETNYATDDDTGALICPFPDCRLRRHDPKVMFKHVHFGPHGNSYGMGIDDFAMGMTR